MTSPTFRIFATTLVLGCSGAAERPSSTAGGSPTSAPSSNTTAPSSVPSAAESGPLVYDLHEWGLIDVYPNPDGQTSQSDLMGGPSVRPEPAGPLVGERPGTSRPGGSPSGRPNRPSLRRKPVLYFHHVSGPVTGQVELGVQVANGRMLEVWPAVNSETPGLARFGFAFESVRGCPVQANLSSLCTGSPAPDGFCERLELHDYETTDANCLTVGDQHVPFLFYRADRTNERLSEYPVELSSLRRAEAAAREPRRESPPDSAPLNVIRAEFGVGDVSRFYRVRYESGNAHISSGTLSAQSSIPGVSVSVPSDRSAIEAQCRQDLTALGLTGSEADAFMRAWADELFGGQGVADSDVLLYWLPASHHRVVSSIDATPAPRNIKRALMVRVQLTSQPTDHPISVSPRRARAAFADND